MAASLARREIYLHRFELMTEGGIHDLSAIFRSHICSSHVASRKGISRILKSIAIAVTANDQCIVPLVGRVLLTGIFHWRSWIHSGISFGLQTLALERSCFNTSMKTFALWCCDVKKYCSSFKSNCGHLFFMTGQWIKE